MKNKSILEAKSADSGEGKSMKSVKIGTQTWAVENLNVSKFKNGDIIEEIHSDGEILSDEEYQKAEEEGKPAWCHYDNDPANGQIYGKLYNWFAVNDPRGLAPTGWHVPSDEEWTELIDNLGGINEAGIKLKAIEGWKENEGEVTCGTNESGFTALPGGEFSDFYNDIGKTGKWWTSTEDSKSQWYRIMNYNDANVDRGYSWSKRKGFSVRCLRD
jgi:uncharacterized protein (TIGR02145 family)